MPDGAPLATWPGRPVPRGAAAIARDGDTVAVDLGTRRLRLDLATGALRGEGAAPPAARVELERDGTRVRVSLAGCATRVVPVPWSQYAAARDGGRFAVGGPEGVRVHDVASGALVFTAAERGEPTLSADGRYLVISL